MKILVYYENELVKQFKIKAKEQKGVFLSILIGTLGANLLVNVLAGKGINRAGKEAIAKNVSEETKSKKQGRGIVRAGYRNKKGRKATVKRQGYKKNRFLMPPHLLTNFETQKYYQNEPMFNDVYSRDNLPKIKDGAYAINLDQNSDTGTH